MAKIMARTSRKRKPEIVDVETVLVNFYDYLASTGCNESTVRWYTLHLYVARKRLNMETLDDWQAEGLVSVMAGLVREKYSNSYIYNIYRAIKRFDAFLVEWGHIPEEQSVAGLLKPPAKPHPEIYPLYPHQVAAMLEMVDKYSRNPLRDKAILSVFYDSGIRRGELCNLRLEDIDYAQRKLTVDGKMGVRECSIGKVGLNHMKHYIDNERPIMRQEPHVFLTQDGLPLIEHALTTLVTRFAERAGIDKKYRGPHALRHGFAYAYIMNGGDALGLSSQLGHKDMDMTKRYVNLVVGDLTEVHDSHSPMKNMKSLGRRTEKLHGHKPQGSVKRGGRVKRRSKKR